MDAIEQVRQLVRDALAADPDVKNKELLRRATELAPEAVDGLTVRQFHGKFRLPVAREQGSKKSAKRGPRRRTTKAAPARARSKDVPADVRNSARAVLRRFAVELSSAEGRSEIVRAVARIDEYADEIIDLLYSPPSPPPTRGRRTRAAEEDTADAMDARAADEQPDAKRTESPPAPERARRRRSKAEVQARAEREAADRAQAVEPPPEPTEATDEQPVALPGLMHDLEDFRRRNQDGRGRGPRLAL